MNQPALTIENANADNSGNIGRGSSEFRWFLSDEERQKIDLSIRKTCEEFLREHDVKATGVVE